MVRVMRCVGLTQYILLCDIVDGWHVRFAYLLCHVSLLLIAFAFALSLLMLMLLIVKDAWSRDRISAIISGTSPLSFLFAILLLLKSVLLCSHTYDHWLPLAAWRASCASP